MWYATMYSMFEQFSSGYYLGRLYVQAHDGPRAVLRAREHERVRRQLYGTGAREQQSGVDATDVTTGRDGDPPLVMRYQQRHFVVDGGEEIPEQTLAIPTEWLPDRPDPLEAREVFLAKADRARQLLRIAVGPEQPTEDGTDHGASPVDPFVPDALGGFSQPGYRQ